MLLISLLAETSAYSSSSGESRYFQTRLTLPPLERSDDILPMLEFGDDFGVSSLPVLYTNDPKVATRWLEEHVAVEGCTLGFDVEVRVSRKVRFKPDSEEKNERTYSSELDFRDRERGCSTSYTEGA